MTDDEKATLLKILADLRDSQVAAFKICEMLLDSKDARVLDLQDSLESACMGIARLHELTGVLA